MRRRGRTPVGGQSRRDAGSPFGSARGTSLVTRSCNCMPPDSRFRCKLHARCIGAQVSLAECHRLRAGCHRRRAGRSSWKDCEVGDGPRTANRGAGVSRLRCRSFCGVPAMGCKWCVRVRPVAPHKHNGMIGRVATRDRERPDPVSRCAVAATGVVLIAPDVLKRTRMAAYMRPDQGQSGLWSAPVEREIDTETCG